MYVKKSETKIYWKYDGTLSWFVIESKLKMHIVWLIIMSCKDILQSTIKRTLKPWKMCDLS